MLVLAFCRCYSFGHMKDMLRYAVLAGVFILPFLPLVVANSLFFPYITGKNFLFRVIVEIVFAAWVVLACYDVRFRPKFSWVALSVVGWGAIVLLADIFGVSPEKSLWSNFERMEGFVAIAHVVLYVLVAGHVISTERLWDRFFNTSIAAASLVVLYAFAQLGGEITINQGGDRVDATLGNASYFAIYMLFHVFIALFMAVRSKTRALQLTYVALALIFAGMLVQTATRGTVLGLMGGGLVMTLWLALFGEGKLRTWSIGVLATLVILIAGFFSMRDAQFIQESPVFSRIAKISLEAGEARFVIWSLAFEGFKERPLLGWGQENFNLVFNKYYDSRLAGEEPWFDRVHNIFFDWLIAAGILGLVSYFAIYFSSIFYILKARWVASKGEGTPTFSTPEQAVLLGLLAGYMFHNVFVFDNIISFLFYGSFLAFIHYRVAREVPSIATAKIAPALVDNIVVPVMAIVLAVSVYFVNIPSLQAASDIIDAFRQLNAAPGKPADHAGSLAAFDRALDRNSFAEQEIREQLTRVAQDVLQDPQVSNDIKQKFADRTEAELLAQIEDAPEDARIRVFIASFYRVVGKPDEALKQLDEALRLSPEKQQIWLEKGLALYQKGSDKEEMLAAFRRAYELSPVHGDSLAFYAGGALYADDVALFDTLITDENRKRLYKNDFILRAAYETKHHDIVRGILEQRVADSDPKNNLQLRVSLAVAYHEGGDTAGAIEVLKKAIEDFPEFKQQGEGFIAELIQGNTPQ